MAARKRRPDQILRDRATIAERYVRGESQAQIAAALGFSQQQVSYDLRCIREEWRTSTLRDIGAHQAEQLAKIDALERECWSAWQRSGQPIEHTTTERGEDEIQVRASHAGRLRLPAKRTRMKASKRTEQQNGNPAYLALVERCIAARCRILGLFAPTNVTVDGRMTFADLFELANGQDGQRPDLHLVPKDDDDPEGASAL